MVLKENVQEARERMKSWWDHEIIDRPVIGYTYRARNFDKDVKFSNWDLAKDVDNISESHENFMKNAHNQYWGAEYFANQWLNYGPGIMAAVFGCVPEFKSATMWFHHPTPVDEIISLLESAKLNGNNEWYSRLKRVTKYVAERCDGQFTVGVSDIGGVLDILSSFLGPTEIIVAMRRKPELIDTCRAIILEKLLKVYDELQNIIDSFNLGCNTWLNVWCPKRYYTMQCDFAAMMSPKYFRRFALPDLVAQAEHMDYAIYHLDGPNALPHLDDLLAQPAITGIQWVPGAQQPGMESEKWFPVYKKIQAAGKNIVIDCGPFGVANLYKNLKPEGLYVKAPFLRKFVAKMYLPKFMKGWGDFFGRNPPKIGENAQMPKSKWHLKMMNQVMENE